MKCVKLNGNSWIPTLILLLSATVFAENAAGTETTFSGQATVVKATVLGLPPVVLADTGPLPPEGGAQEVTLLEASVPGLFTAEVLHASAVGQGNSSRAQASVANLNLTVAGNQILAVFLIAEARAQCSDGAGSVNGDSSVARLVINGQPIDVGTEPNQRINLLVGYVVINEQTSSADGSFGDITVNALHVVIPGVADVVVSSAHADIDCGVHPPCDRDFVTGGGWIHGPSGAKANFAVAGGVKHNDLWGHLTYIDHGAGLKVKGTAVTAYVVTGATSRHIEGACEINGQGGFSYAVDVDDQGEPGRADVFALSLSNGYEAAGQLAGGNIQLHTCR